MIPYVEKIVADFLRTHSAVSALGARIVTKTPASTEMPWVRVTKLDGMNATGGPVEHLVDFMVQFDCYASDDNGTPEVSLLGRTVRAALHDDLPRAAVAGAVVTSVRITGDARLPDTTFAPARERVILTAEIHIHAA